MDAQVCFEFEDQHKEEGKLASRLADVARRLLDVEPRKAATIDTQRVAQRGEQGFVLILLTLKLCPQALVGEAVQVSARVEVLEQLPQARQRLQLDGGREGHDGSADRVRR